MPDSVRRVVTGHDFAGRSIVISDGPAPFVQTNPLRPGWSSTDIFRTIGAPAAIASEVEETTEGPRRQLPTPQSTVIRINIFPPHTESDGRMTQEDSKRVFALLGNETAATFGKGGRHPLMHRTETIDYAIVMAGEITMLLDDGEVVLKAGNVLVQCGTNHAWVNRSNAPAVVCFVLIDGKFENDLAQKLAG